MSNKYQHIDELSEEDFKKTIEECVIEICNDFTQNLGNYNKYNGRFTDLSNNVYDKVRKILDVELEGATRKANKRFKSVLNCEYTILQYVKVQVRTYLEDYRRTHNFGKQEFSILCGFDKESYSHYYLTFSRFFTDNEKPKDEYPDLMENLKKRLYLLKVFAKNAEFTESDYERYHRFIEDIFYFEQKNIIINIGGYRSENKCKNQE